MNVKTMIVKNLASLIKKEDGQALALAIIMVLLGGFMIPPILDFVSNATVITTNYEDNAAHIYSADAGIEHGLWEVKHNNLSRFVPAFDDYDYTSSGSRHYQLDEQINGLDVHVSIKNAWIPYDIDGDGAPVPPDPALAKRLVNSGTVRVTSSSPNEGEFDIKISAIQAKANVLNIQRIGIWIPPSYIYHPGSSTLDDIDNDDEEYYRNPDQELLDPKHVQVIPFGGGGQVVIWDFTTGADIAGDHWTYADSIDFKLLPGVNMMDTMPQAIITVKYDTIGDHMIGEPQFISWIDTTDDQTGFPYAWDSETKLYQINSRAGGAEIEAYTSKTEGQMADTTAGQFLALGNSSLLDFTWGTDTRELQLDESSYTLVDDPDPDLDVLPDNASIVAARLYWTGYLEHALPDKPIAIIWQDDCKTFNEDPDLDDDNNWWHGTSWQTDIPAHAPYSDRKGGIFRGHNSAGSNYVSANYLYLTDDIDLSPYAGKEVFLTWDQGESGLDDSSDCLQYALSNNADGWDWEDWKNHGDWHNAFCDDRPSHVTRITLDEAYLAEDFRIAFRLWNCGGSDDYVYIDDIYIYHLVNHIIWQDDCTNGINSGTWNQTGTDWDQTTRPGTYTAQHHCSNWVTTDALYDDCTGAIDPIIWEIESGTWAWAPTGGQYKGDAPSGGGGVNWLFGETENSNDAGAWSGRSNWWDDSNLHLEGYNGGYIYKLVNTSGCDEVTVSLKYGVNGFCESTDRLKFLFYYGGAWRTPINMSPTHYIFDETANTPESGATLTGLPADEWREFTATFTLAPAEKLSNLYIALDLDNFGGSGEQVRVKDFKFGCGAEGGGNPYLTMRGTRHLDTHQNINISWDQTNSGTSVDIADCVVLELWNDSTGDWDDSLGIGACGSYSGFVSSGNINDSDYLKNFRMRFRLDGFGEANDYTEIDNILVNYQDCVAPVNEDRHLTMDPDSSLNLTAYPEIKLSWDQLTGGVLEEGDYLEYSLWDANISNWVPQGSPPFSQIHVEELINEKNLLKNFRVRFTIKGFNEPDEYCYIDNITVSEQVKLIYADNSVSFKIEPEGEDAFWAYFDNTGLPASTTNPDEARELVATTIDPERIAWFNLASGSGYGYACTKDVTKIIQEYVPNDQSVTFTVGDIDSQCMSRKSSYGGTEFFLGWSLVLVYSSPDTLGHRLIIYDTEDDFVFLGNTLHRDYHCDGFVVPQRVSGEDVAVTIYAFVAEGDPYRTSPPTLGDCLTFNGAVIESEYGKAHSIEWYNTWDSCSVLCSNPGVDVETFKVDWDDGLIAEGDITADVSVWAGNPTDGIAIVYIAMAFRSELNTSGALSYRIK